jgi:amino acid permease
MPLILFAAIAAAIVIAAFAAAGAEPVGLSAAR